MLPNVQVGRYVITGFSKINISVNRMRVCQKFDPKINYKITYPVKNLV